MPDNKNRERFIELAEKRVTRAIRDLRLIGNLSNKSNYSYSEEDVRKIMRVLRSELRAVEQRFHKNGERDEVLFKL